MPNRPDPETPPKPEVLDTVRRAAARGGVAMSVTAAEGFVAAGCHAGINGQQGEAVVVDPEFAARLNRDQGAVTEPELHSPADAGDEELHRSGGQEGPHPFLAHGAKVAACPGGRVVLALPVLVLVRPLHPSRLRRLMPKGRSAGPRRLPAPVRTASSQPGADSRVRQNLALVVGLQGRFEEAEQIARQELSPDQAQANVTYLRGMLAQQNAWNQLKAEEDKPTTN